MRRLEREGWKLSRTKGSHHQFKHAKTPGIVTVPHPKKDLPRGDSSGHHQIGRNPDKMGSAI